MADLVTRVLPPEEWHRLAGSAFDDVIRLVSPDDVRIVVVEDEGRIVGHWAAWRMTHLEGAWVDPAYQKRASVARRLRAATMTEARHWGSEWAMTAACTDDVRRLITKHLKGVAVPGDLYLVRLEERTSCQ